MALSDFNGEVSQVITDGVTALVGWIHNNPTAEAATAKAVAKSWLDTNAPDYATQGFADKLIDRLFSYADGTWVGFRDLVLTYPIQVVDEFVKELSDDTGIRSQGEILHDHPEPDTRENVDGYPVREPADSATVWKRNTKLEERVRVVVGGVEFIVRKTYDPQLVDERIVPNASDWEVI